MRKLIFPLGLDFADLSPEIEERNVSAGVGVASTFSVEDAEYALDALQRRVGVTSSLDRNSLDYRIRILEAIVGGLSGIGQVANYIGRNVEVDSEAVDEDTAETFTTNSGKLALDKNGNAYPNFVDVPDIVPVPAGDYDIRIVKDSVEMSGTDVTFRAYRSGSGTPPEDGIYRVTFIFIKTI